MFFEINKNIYIEDCVICDDLCEVIIVELKNILDRYGFKFVELGDIEKERYEFDERVIKFML